MERAPAAAVSAQSKQARPPGQCEHLYLAGNCPYCTVMQLREQLAMASVGVRLDGPETPSTLRMRAARSEARARVLERTLRECVRERDRAVRLVGRLQRALNKQSAGVGQAETARLRAALEQARAELRITRGLLKARWSSQG